MSRQRLQRPFNVSELVVARKVLPKLEAIGIQVAPTGDPARLDQVLEAVRAVVGRSFTMPVIRACAA